MVPGGSTGSFNYGYGIELPPAEGPVPSVGLSYSSQAVDGHTSSSNNQAGVIGDGWSYTPGYIERTYASCASEEGGNTPEASADRCWDGDSPSITLVLDGTNSPLVLDDDTGEWIAAADPNWKVELLGAPASGSEATTERWRITTADGTEYTFAGRAGETDSRLTVPVFGNHSGRRATRATTSPARSAPRRTDGCSTRSPTSTATGPGSSGPPRPATTVPRPTRRTGSPSTARCDWTASTTGSAPTTRPSRRDE
ncbi:hypothetical protein GCM10029992_01940 [Glycomyces albus]